MQSAYALRICIADTDRGSVRMEMYTNAKEEAKQLKIGGGGSTIKMTGLPAQRCTRPSQSLARIKHAKWEVISRFYRRQRYVYCVK